MDDSKKKNNINDIPSVLPVIPTMDVVIFPHMVVPLLVLDEHIIQGIEQTMDDSKKILLLATKEQPEGYQGPIGIQDLYQVGTVANIMRIMRLPEGGLKVLVQGLVRANVDKILSDKDVLSVQITPLPFEQNESEVEIVDEHVKKILSTIDTMASTGRIFGPDSQVILSQIKDPEKIVDFILSHLNFSIAQAQNLLEKNTIVDLLDCLYDALTNEVETSKIQERIQSETRESINNSQREYYLREQLKAIKKELGEEGDSEIEDLKGKFEKLVLPEEVKTEVEKQLSRLEKIPPDSMENTVIRNHLDWLVALPWGIYSDDNLDIAGQRAHVFLDAVAGFGLLLGQRRERAGVGTAGHLDDAPQQGQGEGQRSRAAVPGEEML